MTLSFKNLKEFIAIPSEEEEMKEMLALFGLCVAKFAVIDHFFKNKLVINKVEFEGKQKGLTYSEKEIAKIDSTFEGKTLGQLKNEFKAVYETGTHEQLFDNIVKVRNILIHPYMKERWSGFGEKVIRTDIYNHLLDVYRQLVDFDSGLKGVSFYTKKNPTFGVKWNPLEY